MSERKDTPEQADFREHCRVWLAENHPGAAPSRLPQNPIEVMNQAPSP